MDQNSEHRRNDEPTHAELETLRLLLRLPREVLLPFELAKPPSHVQRYVQRADRGQLQWLLVDVLHQLRTQSQED